MEGRSYPGTLIRNVCKLLRPRHSEKTQTKKEGIVREEKDYLVRGRGGDIESNMDWAVVRGTSAMNPSLNGLNKTPTTIWGFHTLLVLTNKCSSWMRAQKTADLILFQLLNAVPSLHGMRVVY